MESSIFCRTSRRRRASVAGRSVAGRSVTAAGVAAPLSQRSSVSQGGASRSASWLPCHERDLFCGSNLEEAALITMKEYVVTMVAYLGLP